MGGIQWGQALTIGIGVAAGLVIVGIFARII